MKYNGQEQVHAAVTDLRISLSIPIHVCYYGAPLTGSGPSQAFETDIVFSSARMPSITPHTPQEKWGAGFVADDLTHAVGCTGLMVTCSRHKCLT